MFTDEHLYSIALRKCNHIGDISFRKLVAKIGSAEEAWKSPKKFLLKIDSFGTKTTSDIGNQDHLKFAEKEIDFCTKKNINIHLRHQNSFPNLLLECEDAPAIIYSKGKFNHQQNAISIVGTRHVTEYGKNFIKDFTKLLSQHNAITVSGLALGADTEVHEQSLANNIPTIAVLAHGFHTLYPSKNRNLSELILDKGGALITEFNSSQKPDRENFIQRNRIIAGLSAATIVVETAFGGGSISTATFANGYNREVYALPGKITEKYSQGCNQLIAQNKASTISTIKNLLEDLGFSQHPTLGQLFQEEVIPNFKTSFHEKLFHLIKQQPNICLDELSLLSEFPSHTILSTLLDLELSNLIKSTSSRQYRISK